MGITLGELTYHMPENLIKVFAHLYNTFIFLKNVANMICLTHTHTHTLFPITPTI